MKNDTRNANPPVAVVSVGAIYPGNLGRDGFWRDIISGRDNITDVPPTHWLVDDYYDPDPAAPDKTYCRRGGFISPVDFDPLEFGIPPTALPATDTAQLLALVVAKQVLEEASRSGAVDKARTSVVLGVASATEMVVHLGGRLQRPAWLKGLRDAGVPEADAQEVCDRIAEAYVPWQESSFPGMLGNVVAGRIANRLDLGGTNYVTDAACASSLSALQVALNELYLGQSDTVIAGGVDALNEILMYMCFSKTPAFSPTGDCRPFSDRADGTIIGEGIGMLALRRLEDAERDGNAIYAVVRGLGSSSDGKSTSVYAPRPEGQAQALRRAYDGAGYGPGTVELMEAHGTATKAGDAAEFEALRTVFEPESRGRRQWCTLGSIKSQIGHTKAAAGAAGLIKVVMALHQKVLPPTIKVDRPNSALDAGDSPFFINTKPRPWIRGSNHPRRGSVSSFGFGGSNFHVTVEEYQGPGRRPVRTRALASELVLLSADGPGALAAKCLTEARAAGEDGAWPALAERTQLAFDAAAPERLAIVAASAAELTERLDAAAAALEAGEAPAGPDTAHGRGPGETGKTAFLFPGQGSQYVDMGAGLAMAFDGAREVWDEAADLAEFADAPLHRTVFPPPAFDDDEKTRQQAAVTAMAVAQPAIAAVSLSQLTLLDSLGLRADAVAGHSFGEITALHAAGVLAREETLSVARQRGLLMTEAATGTDGAMTAVAADFETVAGIIEANGLDLVLANDNSPEQVVLSGTEADIARAESVLKKAGLALRRLPVATAFHSPIVAASRRPFAEALARLKVGKPAVPVYANATGAPYPGDAAGIRAHLAEQLAEPVRFRQIIEAMYEAGVRLFVEVGPGAVLTGLVDQCLAERPHIAVNLDRKGVDGVTGLWRAIGRLSACGIPLDLAPLWRDLPAATEERRSAPAHAVKISGANYGKPYPPPGGAADLPPPNPQPGPAPAAPPPVSKDTAWATAFEEFQRQTAETHRQFQQSMAESHQAFLHMAARTLSAVTGGTNADHALPPFDPAPGHQSMPAPDDPPIPGAPIPGAAELGQVMAPPPSLGPQAPPPAAPATAPAPAPHREEAPAPPAASFDIRQVLLGVVAEKTGYPTEMLALDMELEAGLGIDSIKQVEILSALRDRVPGLPEVEPARLADLKTLEQIADFIDSSAPAAPTAAADLSPSDGATPPSSALGASAASTPGDPAQVLLDLVAEKTGYPADMLDLDMELEAGLGIDSIKQVEILSALRDRMPGLPEVAPAQLAELKTLAAIRDFLIQAGGAGIGREDAGAAEPPAPVTPPARAEPPAAAAAAARAPDRYLPVAIDAPVSGFAMPGLAEARRVAVTPAGGKIADALVAELKDRGITAEPCTTPPEDADAVICLHGLAKSAGHRDSLNQHLAALAAARQVAGRFAEGGGVFVTVQDTGGDFGFETNPGRRAWLGGFPGLVKTLALECPGTAVKAIDIKRNRRSAAVLARAIADELLGGGPEIEVGLAPGRRRVTVALKNAGRDGDDELTLADASVVVASGGGRGVTARALERLAARQRLRFVLLGRTPLDPAAPHLGSADSEAALKAALFEAAEAEGRTPVPAEIASDAARIMAAREILATLDRLTELGSEARYIALDATDAKAVAHALEEVRQDWGGVSALIHGAGVIADKRIADKTDDQFQRVFRTKVAGLHALLAATAADKLKAVCLFSSAAARSGNPGQSDYAVANEVLNKVAQAEARRRGSDCAVKSINWGPWDGGMVDSTLKAHFERQGVALISIEDGTDFLVRELASGAGPVEIVAGSALRTTAEAARMIVTVDAENQPFLANHRIKGNAVLPVVLVVEWFMRAAKAVLPDMVPLALRDLHVLKGVILERYPAGERFEIRAEPEVINGKAFIAMALLSTDGRVRYRARVEMGHGNDRGQPRQAPSNGDFIAWPWHPGEVYDGKLFHGPDFQVIRDLEGISDDGGVGTFEGTISKAWPGGPWLTDPAALDGGMQLALLWGLNKAQRVFLPIRIGAFIPHGPLPADGLLRCVFRTHFVDATRTENDLTFATLDGRVVAELQGVEMYPIDSGRDGGDGRGREDP